MAAISAITSTAAGGLSIGRNGATNPVLKVNCATASQATGVTIVGAAAAGGVAVAAISSGTDENMTIDAKGAGTVTVNATATGAISLARNTTVTGTFGVTGAETITSASASALTVGANGATNPVLKIDGSTASAATGLQIKGAAAAGGVAALVISSGTNENLTIDAKGSGTISLNNTGTGAVTSGQNFKVASGKTLSLLDTGTGTATAGAATLSKSSGKVTSEALTTAAGAAYTLTLTNTQIAAADIVMTNVANGTNTQGVPIVGLVTPGSGSCTIVVRNEHASQAFNGTIVVSFLVVKVT